jgi:hypothetical protein
MRRLLTAGCVAFALAGCERRSETRPAPSIEPPVEVVKRNTDAPAEIRLALETDETEWPVVTEKAIRVSYINSTQCLRPTLGSHGPHFKPAIVVRTNPEALDAFLAKQSPMPVGTVVLKEKHTTVSATDAPNEFGAMIKREAGYDPENGDWEYVFGTISPKVTVERGKLANCIACHSAYAKENDYLFRSYVPEKVAAVSEDSGR